MSWRILDHAVPKWLFVARKISLGHSDHTDLLAFFTIDCELTSDFDSANYSSVSVPIEKLCRISLRVVKRSLPRLSPVVTRKTPPIVAAVLRAL
jgi:hypothetical protein